MSFLIIIMLIGLNEYIVTTTKTIRNTITIDYALTNITLNYEKTYQELQNHHLIKEVSKAYLFTDTYIKELDAISNYNISSDFDKITHYFNIDINNETLEKVKSLDTYYVILPIKYHYLNKLNIEDKVTLTLNKDYPNLEFTVVGFYESQITEIIFTNLYYLQNNHTIFPNAIILNAYDKENVKRFLIETYAKEMYYIIDFHELVENDLQLMVNLNSYFTYLILILITSFLITILNNALLEFTNSKNILARLRVLGISIKKLLSLLISEKVIQFIFTIVSLLAIINTVKESLPFLLLFYGTYQIFDFTIKSIYIGISISFVTYGVSYLAYFHRVKNTNFVDIIKIF